MNIWELGDLCTPWCVHVAATLRIANHIEAGVTRIDGSPRPPARMPISCTASSGTWLPRACSKSPRPAVSPSTSLPANCWTGRPAGFRSRQLRRTHGPRLERPLKPSGRETGLPRDLRPAVLGGPRGPSGDRRQIRRADGAGGARHSRPGHPPRRRLGFGAHRRGCRRRNRSAARGNPARPAHVRGTLVDRPATVARSRDMFQAAGVADRITLAAQSFFDPLPAGADLYLLKSVLSDWPDPEAALILRRCAEAARPAGRVVLLNGVSPDETGGPPPDVLMMVLVGGKGRTLTEFRELARTAGLEVQAAGREPSGRFVVECRPV